MGFEPTVSTLTGWRALRAAPQGRVQRTFFSKNLWKTIFSTLHYTLFHLVILFPVLGPTADTKPHIEQTLPPAQEFAHEFVTRVIWIRRNSFAEIWYNHPPPDFEYWRLLYCQRKS